MAWTWQVVAAIALYALVAPAVAQTSESESAAVLQEVRLLRQAIETLARSSVVSHVSFGRLQIHEQRIVAASVELKKITASIDQTAMMIDNYIESARSMDERDLSKHDAVQREQHRVRLEQLKREQESLELRVQRLTADRANVEQRLTLEQGQWAELSQKLDELERTLLPRRQ